MQVSTCPGFRLRSVCGKSTGLHVLNAMYLAPHYGKAMRKACASQGYANEGVRCWSGNDDEAHEARHSYGGQGVISVTSNLLPGLFSRLMRSPNQELNSSLQELIAWLFCEPNPISVNTAMVRACHPDNLCETGVHAYLQPAKQPPCAHVTLLRVRHIPGLQRERSQTLHN